MRDLMGMMKKAQELQSKMSGVQEELAELEVSGSAGGGMVEVTLSGKGDLKALKIDPSLLGESDATMIEDLMMAAHAEARKNLEQAAAEKMAEVTEGLPIPPGMKLPF